MKARYKFVILVVLLWIGVSSEGARNLDYERHDIEHVNATYRPYERPSYTQANIGYYQDVADQIKAYEEGKLQQHDNSPYYQTPTAYQPYKRPNPNVVARAGGNIGSAIQTVVNEVLGNVFRWFDSMLQ